MAEPSYQIVMNAGPNPGKVFPLDKNEIFIGRDLTNDVVINDAEVSRRHARLVAQAGGYILEDLGSTNGTFVNGQRLMGPYILRPGETVTLGEHVSLAFEQLRIDPDATMVSSTYMPNMPAAPAVTPPFEPASPPLPSSQVYNQPQVPPSPPPVSFANQVAPGPAIVVEPPVVPEKRRGISWVLIVILIVLLLVCACGALLYYIDTNSLWCKVFPFIPGCTAP